MAGGRPTDYKTEFCQLVIEMMDRGKSKAQICREIRINFDTFNQWEKQHPEFSEAVKAGLVYSQAEWEGYGHDNLMTKEFNSRLYELNMMNRFGWNKKTDSKVDASITPHEDWTKILK